MKILRSAVLTAGSLSFGMSRIDTRPRRTFTPPALGERVLGEREQRRTPAAREHVVSESAEDSRFTRGQRERLEEYDQQCRERIIATRKVEREYNQFLDARNQAEEDKNRAESDVNVARQLRNEAMAERQREETELIRIRAERAAEDQRVAQARQDLDRLQAAQQQPLTGFQMAYSRSILAHSSTARPMTAAPIRFVAPGPLANPVTSVVTGGWRPQPRPRQGRTSSQAEMESFRPRQQSLVFRMRWCQHQPQLGRRYTSNIFVCVSIGGQPLATASETPGSVQVDQRRRKWCAAFNRAPT